MDSNHDIVPTLRMFDGLLMNKAADEIDRLRALLKPTPNISLPPLGDGPRRKILVTIEVPENFEDRMDMQWVVEREINADRWSWSWSEQEIEFGVVAEYRANLLMELCHSASLNAGWWIKNGVDIRDNPYCFSNKLMLIVSELAESMEGDRKGVMDDHIPHRTMREVELADALIRIFDLAGAYEMDIGGAISEKLAYNKTRADHQPEARAAAGGKTY